MGKVTTALAVMALASAGGEAFAAGKPKGPPPGAGDVDGPPMKHKEKIKAELGLDDATAIKLFAALDTHRKTMKPIREEVEELKVALDEALAAKKPDEKRISDLLDRFATNRRAAEAERWLLADTVRKILTPSQAARFLMLMHKKHGPKGDRALG